ncbi:phosphate ABC transporter permease PtsA [filamentous cyanobacterium CCT1]|nr:phosphate ABC transporter permease PtsA [filamentous cyanobacterium CCT1]PSN77793.1 phosphate ABC transporter permease PtsA [filamentous cyanobacterium CCP4]
MTATDYRSRADRARRAIAEQTSGPSYFDLFWTGVAGFFTLLALIPLVLVLVYVVIRGFSRLNWAAFTQLPPPPLAPDQGGFANALIGTLIMVGIGALVSVPFGVLAAIYLSEFSQGQVPRWIRFATNVLSGVPSILMGVFIYGLFVITTGTYSAVAGGFALGVLMLPIIVRTTDESLQIVPKQVRWAAIGMGASKFQTVLRVVLPAALPAIATGLTLAVARAAGETAPLLFTALFSQYWLDSLFQPTASLSVLVYNFATVPYEGQQRLAWAAALILVGIVLLTSILARWATRKQIY